LRHRGLPRAGMVADSPTGIPRQRRNSTLSDSVSEARNSIRSSTDDLFFPRVTRQADTHVPDEESHWHSAPLAMALLPAIAGLFFQNGSAVITDVTLLALAAIFLNWSVRLPWDWYRSAQAIRVQDSKAAYDVLEEEGEDDQDDHNDSSNISQEPKTKESRQCREMSAAAVAATRELQTHELVALASCFVFPMIGTWVLHTIRSKLSRPSEGLVSNYNLTIFLLASEIRPFSHLLKMVQARTLYLQKVVASAPSEEDKLDASKIPDLARRLEELEAHVAEAAAARLSQDQEHEPAPPLPSIISQATSEVRKGLQPEIDALNRAVRRYEKRTALTSFQTDSRFQRLEAQVQDALALAASAQRSNLRQRHSYTFKLLDSLCAVVVLP
ncbi:hypothetical protein ASPZODRAFT_32106, partial [Penicilliopsis zonata CBS 506.65]